MASTAINAFLLPRLHMNAVLIVHVCACVFRDSTISNFKAGRVQILVATSVCARGLDVKVTDVIRHTVRQVCELFWLRWIKS
jgi:late competence protein required for DNA uptake (superfamily II DNA/RNA helicase)